MHRRYPARRSGNAQAHLPSAARISHFFDGLWSGLGQTQAHDSRVFGASQSPDQGAVYECAPPIHLGRAGAHTLASRGCQAGLRVSQVAGVSGSIARVQSPHQAVSNRDRKSTRLNSSHSQISYAVFCLQNNDVSPWSMSLHRVAAPPSSTAAGRSAPSAAPAPPATPMLTDARDVATPLNTKELRPLRQW